MSDKTERTKEVALSEAASRYCERFDDYRHDDIATAAFLAGAQAMEEYRQSSPVESDLIDAYDKYIAVLIDEINSLTGLAFVHGWRSKNVEAGKACREAIRKLKGLPPIEETKEK